MRGNSGENPIQTERCTFEIYGGMIPENQIQLNPESSVIYVVRII